MKRAKRLTRTEKILLSKRGLDPKGFLRLRGAAEYQEFIEVSSGKILTIWR